MEIDDIIRFREEKKLCAYAGLVPSTYASGGKVFHGRITKQATSGCDGHLLKRYPQPPDKHVIVVAPLSIHTDFRPIFLQETGECVASKTRALVVVYDTRLALLESLFDIATLTFKPRDYLT